MSTGVGTAEEPIGSPRLTTELMRMNRSIGELVSSQTATEKKVDEVHKAIFIGNHNPGIIQWLLRHDGQISKLLGRTSEQKKHTLKTAGYSGLGLSCLYLALKLTIFLLNGHHWPTVP